MREENHESNGNDERTAELAKRILGLFDKLINSGTVQPSVFATLKRAFSDYIRQSEHDDPHPRRRDLRPKTATQQASSEGR
jgi:hypothetical protein